MDQLGRKLRQPIVLILGPAIDDRDILAFDKTDLLQTTVKSTQTVSRRLRRRRAEESNHRHCLLRARRERPRSRRAAEQRDELAPFHSMTSSAVASSEGGRMRSSMRAVWRLITNSSLDDCTTGRSSGLAPLRMRAAYRPSWRHASARLAP